MEEALNAQIVMEGYASSYYLSAASFCDHKGLAGIASFLYAHADEERMHMMKMFHYVNDCGGHAQAPALEQPPCSSVPYWNYSRPSRHMSKK